LLFAIFLSIILFARHMAKSYILSGLNEEFVLPRMQYQTPKTKWKLQAERLYCKPCL